MWELNDSCRIYSSSENFPKNSHKNSFKKSLKDFFETLWGILQEFFEKSCQNSKIIFEIALALRPKYLMVFHSSIHPDILPGFFFLWSSCIVTTVMEKLIEKNPWRKFLKKILETFLMHSWKIILDIPMENPRKKKPEMYWKVP